jgi:hypothetical protein
MKTLLLALALSAQTATPPQVPTAPTAPPAAEPATPTAISPVERRDTASLAAAIEALRARYPQKVVVSDLAFSPRKRAIQMLTLSADGADQQRPAILRHQLCAAQRCSSCSLRSAPLPCRARRGGSPRLRCLVMRLLERLHCPPQGRKGQPLELVARCNALHRHA